MWSDSTLMYDAGCPHSPPGSVTEYSPKGPTKKHVHFELTQDLGYTLPLPDDLACYLGDPTDEWTNGPQLPDPLDTSSPR